jgi:hypothetical protein
MSQLEPEKPIDFLSRRSKKNDEKNRLADIKVENILDQIAQINSKPLDSQMRARLRRYMTQAAQNPDPPDID